MLVSLGIIEEMKFNEGVFNPIPTCCCHVTLMYGLIPPMAGRNRVNKDPLIVHLLCNDGAPILKT